MENYEYEEKLREENKNMRQRIEDLEALDATRVKYIAQLEGERERIKRKINTLFDGLMPVLNEIANETED